MVNNRPSVTVNPYRLTSEPAFSSSMFGGERSEITDYWMVGRVALAKGEVVRAGLSCLCPMLVQLLGLCAVGALSAACGS